MRNYNDMLDDIMDTCCEIEYILGADKAPLWPASTYATVLHVKRLAATVKVADGAAELAEQANRMAWDAKTLKDYYRRSRTEERKDENLERFYRVLHTQTCDLMCEAMNEADEIRVAKLNDDKEYKEAV